MSRSGDTGFDAFFQAVTRSPEFRTAANKEWKKDMKGVLDSSVAELSKSIESLAESTHKLDGAYAKAGSIYDSVRQGVGANDQAAWDEGNSYASGSAYGNGGSSGGSGGSGRQSGSSRGSKTNGGDAESELFVEHFECENPETFGFKGIAGMTELKQELQEHFIAPLKFRFLVESYAEESDSSAPAYGSSVASVPLDAPIPSSSLPPSDAPNAGAPAASGSEFSEAAKKREMYRKLYASYERFKVSIPTGLLFYGPPGTGKTFITKKLAEELGAGFVKKSVGEFGSSYMHATTKNIREFFAQAKAAAEKEPIILFLDEIDSILSARTGQIDSNKAEEVSQFLQEFNELASAKNLIVIAATNRPDHLDSAILRSGRFDKKCYIGPPDHEARKDLFRIYIEKEGRPHEELDYEELARLTESYVSADIEAICDDVSRNASQDILSMANAIESGAMTLDEIDAKIGGGAISMDRIRASIAKTTSSLKMVDMSIYEQWKDKIA